MAAAPVAASPTWEASVAGPAQDSARATFAAAIAALPAADRAGVLCRIDAARAEGLPVAPLERKVVEGVAKQAAPAQILTVVGAVAVGLRTASQALGPRASEAELTAAGTAAQAGLTAGHLARVRTSLPHGRAATQAFVVLTDLARRGVPPGDAAGVVARLARAGAADEAFAVLRAQVAGDLTAGATPRAALLRRADAMVGGRGPVRAPVFTPAPGPLDP